MSITALSRHYQLLCLIRTGRTGCCPAAPRCFAGAIRAPSDSMACQRQAGLRTPVVSSFRNSCPSSQPATTVEACCDPVGTPGPQAGASLRRFPAAPWSGQRKASRWTRSLVILQTQHHELSRLRKRVERDFPVVAAREEAKGPILIQPEHDVSLDLLRRALLCMASADR